MDESWCLYHVPGFVCEVQNVFCFFDKLLLLYFSDGLDSTQYFFNFDIFFALFRIGNLVRATLMRLLYASSPLCPSHWLAICRAMVGSYL